MPSAKQAARATSGSSSIASGISSPPTSVPCSAEARARKVADRLAAAPPHRLELDLGAHPLEDRQQPGPGRVGADSLQRHLAARRRAGRRPGRRRPRRSRRARQARSVRGVWPGARRCRRAARQRRRRRRRACARCGRGCAQRLAQPGLPLGEQSGEEQARLDLGAGDRQLVIDSPQRRRLDLEWRQALLAAAQLGAHLAQWRGDAVDRAAPDRVVAVERPLAARLPGEPAGQQAQQGAGVADVDRAGAAGLRRPTPWMRITGSMPLGIDALDFGAECPHRPEGRTGVGGVEIALDLRSRLPPSRRSGQRGGRSTCRPAGAGCRAGAQSDRSASPSDLGAVADGADAVAELADQGRGALGLLVARRPRARPRRRSCRAPGRAPCPRC